MSIHLSVNINKVALLRNSRVGNNPDLYAYARDCEDFGADGITVHPRPDERHIRYADIPILKAENRTEFNIEGNPTEAFVKLVLENRPTQVTLVPDDPNQLTSDHGWDTKKHTSFLQDVCGTFKEAGIRTSIFLDPEVDMLEGAVETGCDRVELYTGVYADMYALGAENAQEELEKHIRVAKLAHQYNIDLNAGHDLNLDNLKSYAKFVPNLKEVSIGHALTIDAIYYGLKNAISMYHRCL